VRTIAFLICVGIFAFGCGDVHTIARAADEEVSATASRLRVRTMGEFKVIFGYLTVQGRTRTLLTADLECFALQVGSSKSDSIWVDSFVDIQRGDYPAQNGKVAVAVYWAMKDFKHATEQELRNATLSIVHPFLGPCFQFEAPEKRK